MNIRIATTRESDDIKKVYLYAFAESESEIVSNLSIDLLSEKTMPQTISLVAETIGTIVGHIAFSPVSINNNPSFQGYILAPLGIMPEYQKRGIGSKLIEYGIHQLSNNEINILFVYGDPKYYGRFGFKADAAKQYIAPYKLQYPLGWQAIVLKECNIENPPVAITCVTSLCNPRLW